LPFVVTLKSDDERIDVRFLALAMSGTIVAAPADSDAASSFWLIPWRGFEPVLASDYSASSASADDGVSRIVVAADSLSLPRWDDLQPLHNDAFIRFATDGSSIGSWVFSETERAIWPEACGGVSRAPSRATSDDSTAFDAIAQDLARARSSTQPFADYLGFELAATSEAVCLTEYGAGLSRATLRFRVGEEIGSADVEIQTDAGQQGVLVKTRPCFEVTDGAALEGIARGALTWAPPSNCVKSESALCSQAQADYAELDSFIKDGVVGGTVCVSELGADARGGASEITFRLRNARGESLERGWAVGFRSVP